MTPRAGRDPSIPRASLKPRWLPSLPAPAGLPEPEIYQCRRIAGPLTIDGSLADLAWSDADWAGPFVEMVDGRDVPLDSRIALLWDETCLYAGYRFVDPDPTGITTQEGDWVFLTDPDAELLLHGDDHYYEIGLNPINVSYEVRWTWLEPLLARQDHAELERLLMIPNFHCVPRRPGELIGRFADHDYRLPGLRHETFVGQLHDGPGEPAYGWSVEMALPWESLRDFVSTTTLPPSPGTELRVQAYRAHHNRSDPVAVAAMEERWGAGASPFSGWTWSRQGNEDVHNPERWVRVRF